MSRQLRLRSLAGIASALLAASCANFTGEAEHTRLERAARAVLPMARVSAAAGQTETAERLYRRLLDLDPESVSARTGLGDLAIDRKKPAEAMRWYEEALERAEGHARSPVLLAHGRAALAAGRIDTARESLTRFVTAEPPPPDAQLAWGYNGLALVAMFEDDLDEAISLFENAAVRAPDQTRIIDNLARARAVLASRPPSPEPPPPPTPATAEPDAAPRDAGGEDPGATAAALLAAPQERALQESALETSGLETSEPEESVPPAAAAALAAEPEAPPPAADAIATAESESTSLASATAEATEPETTPSGTDTAASPPPSPEPPPLTTTATGGEDLTVIGPAGTDEPETAAPEIPAPAIGVPETAAAAGAAEPGTTPSATDAVAVPPPSPEPPAATTATAGAEPGATPRDASGEDPGATAALLPAAPQESVLQESALESSEPEASAPPEAAAEAVEPEAPPPQPATPETKVPETASDREIAALMRDAGAFLVREGEEWFLQVAAFVKPERAESMAGQIHRRSGVPVKIVRVERNAEPLHLVRVGPVRSRRALRAVLDAFGAGDG